MKHKTAFKIKSIQTRQSINSLESKGKKRKKNSEDLPQLEITEVVLVHCNLVSNISQHDSRELRTIISNR